MTAKPPPVVKPKKKSLVEKKIPKAMLQMDPPLMSRDPKPMTGLMEMLTGDTWVEHQFTLTEDCILEWVTDAEAGTTSTLNGHSIWVTRIDVEENRLEMVEELENGSFTHQFRSKDVARWQDAIMNVGPPKA